MLAVSALLAVAWACLTPAFQAPDEQRHYTYVQTIAENFDLPGDPAKPGFSTQVIQARQAVNSDQVAAQWLVKPEWNADVEHAWAATQGAAPRDDGGGPSPASTYPPVAYAWQALGYLAASSGTMFDQLLGARLMSAFWLPFTVLGTWLFAGELFGRRRLLQTVAASVPALAPMVVFISSSVGPDGMLYAVWTFAIWLGVRCVKRGVPLVDGAVFFALVGFACTVKATSYALLPAALLVAVLGLMARRPLRVGRLLRLAGVVALPLAITLGAWVLAAALLDRPAAAQVTQTTTQAAPGTNWRELFSYVWQYYLPRVPGQNDYSIPTVGGGYPLFQVWIIQGWAAFGWLEVKFATWVYKALALLTAAVGGAALVALWRVRRAIDWRVAGFLAIVCLALLAGLHWTDYHQIEIGIGFMQARYLFPIVAVLGAAVAAAVSVVPARLQGVAAGGWVAGLFVFHLFCIGLVLERFYA
jgi:4-amino-4-deoxy-L-arabinose transferase-like glycosyltransferase